MKSTIGFLVILFLAQSCINGGSPKENAPLLRPSVSVVHPAFGTIGKTVQTNGQVVYLNKANITAPITGYITMVNIKPGDWVKKGDLLFKIQTRESRALQGTAFSVSNELSNIPVYASSSGFINSLQMPDAGLFINEGSSMATLVKNKDLVIQVNAPFQYSTLLRDKKQIEIELPDEEVLTASFYKALPKVDPVSQTQQIYFKLNGNTLLPENLNVIVKIPEEEKKGVIILPKNVILTNETQDEFWIMKVTKDSLAIKVPVVKGIENRDKIEIVKPALKTTDRIIQKGAYGLPDSTKVKIIK